MNSELILALAHLERMVRQYVPANAAKQLALRELEIVEFQIALAVGMEAAA